jgi:3-hydroxyisobutyrate dehydrogenase
MKLAFLGLGVMGFPMAGHLQKAGHSVTVYNRNAEKAAKWVATHGGASAKTPRDAAKDADIVLMCVGNDDDVRSVVYGDSGALAGMKAGAILVDHTTASALLTRRCPVVKRAQRTVSSASCAAAIRRRLIARKMF